MLLYEPNNKTYHPRTCGASDISNLVTKPFIAFAAGSASKHHPPSLKRRDQSGHSSHIGTFTTDCTALARKVSGLAFGGTRKGCAPSKSQALNHTSQNQGGRRSHPTYETLQCNTLEHAQHGQGAKPIGGQHSSHLQLHNLKSHLIETFKLSRDKNFVEKLSDVVVLYLNPPEKALVLCVDEKSQIQALERTQPLLPLRSGIPARQTHDYKRNGTTTLFAALSVLDGKVIGDGMPRHRHQEFIRFLKKIDMQRPADRDLHLIVDNYATHKHPRVKAWFRRHPRFHLHFTPTSSSWLNMVECWFREITDKRIRRGSFSSVQELISAINEYLENHNQNPQVFVWSAPVDKILAKISKCKEALDALH